ncbi:hypothetical protein PQQ99_09795 [Paraburkholderia sediminicola]|uniref:hypothetical protein n=1 Tax=Paraburkholderia sediminicola TaxID=458836 RepID=UPI0038B71FE1
MKNQAAEAHIHGASHEVTTLIARLDAMDLEPLDEAASILNCVNEANGLPGWYSPKILLSHAWRGELRITARLPDSFILHSKNGLRLAHAPFPRGFDFLCIEPGTAREIYQSQGGTVELRHAVNVKPDGSIDRFVAAQPYANISLADLRIDRDEIIRLIRGLPNAISSEASEQATDSAPPVDNGLSPREKKIRAIEAEADGLKYPRLRVPKGGKKAIQVRCKAHYANLFGAGNDPFLDAWKHAVAAGRIRMADHDTYSGK